MIARLFLVINMLVTENMKTVILDFDGTLADTRSLIVKTMQQTIRQLGLASRTDDECAAMIGLPLRKTFTELIPMTEEMGTRCADTYTMLFLQNNVPGAVPLFPHVKETISELHRRGYVLAIASSRGRDTLIDFLEEMDLQPYISMVVAATDVENAKPAPDMVLRILETTGAAAADAIVVGDTSYDIDMGISAGVRTCGVTYGNGSRAELASADVLITDFGELLDVLG